MSSESPSDYSEPIPLLLKNFFDCFLERSFYTGFPVFVPSNIFPVFFIFIIDSFPILIQYKWFWWYPHYWFSANTWVHDPCLADSSAFSFPVTSECSSIQYRVNLFMSASSFSSLRHSQTTLVSYAPWTHEYACCSLYRILRNFCFVRTFVVQWAFQHE